MKNALSLFLALALASQAWAYDFEAEGLYFNITGDNTAEVTYPNYSSTSGDYYDGYTKPTGSLSIPAKVTNSSTSAEYDVTSIGSEAFYGCSGLTSVTIPNSVTSIGNGVFYNCFKLTSVTIPKFVTSIGDRVFSGCSKLISVTIPESVTSIAERAFYDCTSLTRAEFSSIESLCTIEFADEYSNPLYYANHLYITGEENEVKELVIPDNVTSIGSFAFACCNSLTRAEFPSIESLCTIKFYGEYSNPLRFAHHLYITGEEKEVTELVIPDNVTSIDSYSFYGCSELTSVAIPNSVISLGAYTFYGCKKLTSISIPANVRGIGGYSFYGCSGLTSVTIGNSVTSIGSSAFAYCRGLTSVTIGNSVTSIGERAFEYCSGLTSVTIPNSVKRIGRSAFFDCSGLTTVTIPNSVKSIGSGAFYDCSNLKTITIPSTIHGIETNFATLKNTTVYFESANPKSQFYSTSYYSSAQKYLKAIYTGCRVIRAGAADDKEGQVTIEGNYAVVADDGSVWYTKNGSATLTATPAEGYHFVRWDDDDESATDNPRNVTVTQSRTYTAVFEADEPTALAANDTQDMKVATAHGAIVITNATSEVWVYDIAGQCIAHELPAQKITISPNKKGLFVVKSPSARVRVMVY